MPVLFLKDSANTAPKNAKILGLDVGKKTIGLSLSDSAHTIATPLKTIHRKKFTRDADMIAALINEYEIGGFIIGYPINIDGTEGRSCQSIRDFAAEFVKHPAIIAHLPDPWVALWDERFSTDTVEGFVDKHVDISKRRAKDRGIIDKLAACHILQTAINYIALKSS